MRNGLGKSLILFQQWIYSMQYENKCKHELYQSLISIFFFVFYLYSEHFLISSYGIYFWSFVYVIFYFVSAGITTLMSSSYGLDSYLFLSKDGKDAVHGRIKGRRVFISRQSRLFSFVDNMIKVPYPYLYFELAFKHLCFPPRKRYK